MKILSISIHDPNNLGDQVCNPTDYFALPNVQKVDAWDFNEWMYDTESHIIFGGGGLIHGMLADYISRVPRVPNRKLIAWGLGHNQHGQTTNDYGGVLDGFDLIGVRDFKRSQEQGWDYVPCASCMNATFDEARERHKYRTQSFCVYYHWESPIYLKNPPFAYLSAPNDVRTIAIPLNLMASTMSVITNTYHGAYWAMLLGCATSIYEPFSSRFYDFKHQPPFCESGSWNMGGDFFASPDYFDECRDLNRKFYEKAKTTLGIHAAGTSGGDSNSGDTRVDGVARSGTSSSAVESHTEENRSVPQSAGANLPEGRCDHC